MSWQGQYLVASQQFNHPTSTALQRERETDTEVTFPAYVDTSLVGTENLDKAAIFNSEGNSVWATSAGFTVSPQEMQAVVAAYKDEGTDGVKKVQSEGLHIAGERFVVIKADDRSIYGKKVRKYPALVDYVPVAPHEQPPSW